MTNLYLRDNGAGALPNAYGVAGTVDYTSKEVVIQPDATTKQARPVYGTETVGTESHKSAEGGDWVTTTSRTILKAMEYVDVVFAYPAAGGTVKAKYLPAAGSYQSASETVTLTALEVDLTKGYAERITRGSLRMTLGGSTFVDTAGSIYRDPAPDTGAGSVAGTLDASTGKVRLTAWTAGGSNTVALQALTTQVGSQPIDRVSFRTPVSPIKSGTLQLRWSDLTGATFSKTVDGTGKLQDNDCTITVDFQRGMVHARFGRWRPVSELTDQEKAEVWYSPEAIVTIGEIAQIWKPRMAQAETIIYNAVASTYLPPDSELLGLDAAKLPPDGKALIFGVGRLVLVHHTAQLPVESLSPTQQINCGRTRLYHVTIEDSLGARLGLDQFTVDRVTGVVTLSAALDISGFTPPWVVRHTVADLARTVSTDINGTLTLMSPLTHPYPADESYCSGVLFFGTLQARVSNLFAQSAWTGVWADTLIGSAPLSQYNDVLYPIRVTNAAAYPDRFLVKFTSSTAFQVIGENFGGVIGVGDINTDCAPINSKTGATYFTIDHRGWGGGWATGNCLRFDLHGAGYPITLVRAVQPSESTGLTDRVELMIVGNVSA